MNNHQIAEIAQQLRASGSVYAEDEAALLVAEARSPEELSRMIEARVTGLPIEQILGWAEFCGLKIIVEPGVFVPRRRTEFLASQARKHVKPGSIIVDLGCGAGALGLAVANELEGAQLFATDVDPAAVLCARKNLEPNHNVYEGDLFEPLPQELKGCIDILLANMPYVPTDAIELLPREARKYEHVVALDGGNDGLDLHRRVAYEARGWLSSGGQIFIEISERQVPVMFEVFAEHDFVTTIRWSADYEATVMIGRKKLS